VNPVQMIGEWGLSVKGRIEYEIYMQQTDFIIIRVVEISGPSRLCL